MACLCATEDGIWLVVHLTIFSLKPLNFFSCIYSVGVERCLASHLVFKTLLKNKKISLPLLKPKSLYVVKAKSTLSM